MSDAPERLIEAVERGDTLTRHDFHCMTGSYDLSVSAVQAHAGSLDAAKALHDALLPGWTACVGQNAHHGDWNAFVRLAEDGTITKEHCCGTDDNPARAWLLAVLRAKLAEADNSTGPQKTAD